MQSDLVSTLQDGAASSPQRRNEVHFSDRIAWSKGSAAISKTGFLMLPRVEGQQVLVRADPRRSRASPIRRRDQLQLTAVPFQQNLPCADVDGPDEQARPCHTSSPRGAKRNADAAHADFTTPSFASLGCALGALRAVGLSAGDLRWHRFIGTAQDDDLVELAVLVSL